MQRTEIHVSRIPFWNGFHHRSAFTTWHTKANLSNNVAKKIFIMLNQVKRLIQALFFVAIWLVAQRFVTLYHLPIPAAVVGLFFVVALLLARVVPAHHVAAGANWLLGDMLLFFIPPLMAIIQFRSLLATHGLQILAAIVLGCLTVMVGTGLIVEQTLRWERSRQQAMAPRSGGKS
ncbi:MAG: CidA/LrgA family protein [Betaproteobacteria bacterium]|nr:CidA/LrgA family protein [Betaproteobacteria bacterium]